MTMRGDGMELTGAPLGFFGVVEAGRCKFDFDSGPGISNPVDSTSHTFGPCNLIVALRHKVQISEFDLQQGLIDGLRSSEPANGLCQGCDGGVLVERIRTRADSLIQDGGIQVYDRL